MWSCVFAGATITAGGKTRTAPYSSVRHQRILAMYTLRYVNRTSGESKQKVKEVSENVHF